MARRNRSAWKELTDEEKTKIVRRVDGLECHKQIMRDFGICSGQFIHIMKQTAYVANATLWKSVPRRRHG